MNQVRVITGNIFTTGCQTLVNTVNCAGVMGAGLALECRLRHPDMHTRYVRLCEQGALEVGKLWLYRAEPRSILNFPTKKHWRQPSHPSYLHLGLQNFMRTYQRRGILSIAFPLLGTQHGGLDQDAALSLMLGYLQDCEIPVEVYRHDPAAPDDLYGRFKALMASATDDQVRAATRLRSPQLRALRDALASPRVHQLNQLAAWRGVGDRTLEAAFRLTESASLPGQPGLL